MALPTFVLAVPLKTVTAPIPAFFKETFALYLPISWVAPFLALATPIFVLAVPPITVTLPAPEFSRVTVESNSPIFCVLFAWAGNHHEAADEQRNTSSRCCL